MVSRKTKPKDGPDKLITGYFEKADVAFYPIDQHPAMKKK
jgi:hypothetical protein